LRTFSSKIHSTTKKLNPADKSRFKQLRNSHTQTQGSRTLQTDALLVLLGRQKYSENIAFLSKASSMGTLIGLIALIWLIFVQPFWLDGACPPWGGARQGGGGRNRKMQICGNAKCKSHTRQGSGAATPIFSNPSRKTPEP
jgi:hypothetical protein